MVTVMVWFAEVVANVSHAPMFSSYSLMSCDIAWASPSTEIMSDTRMAYFWPLSAGEAAGVTGVIMSHDCVDIYNPKVIRSTMGSVYRMPFVYVEHLPETLEVLAEAGIHSYAAHLKGKNSYDQEDYTRGTAFLIGNEGNGLRDEVADVAECYIKIPMCGEVESLNAAVASSVLMFEAARQRR